MTGPPLLSIHRIGGPLSAPASSARRTWTERRGLIVTLEDGGGNRGVGECSPLPGFSPDTLDEGLEALRKVDVDALADLDDGASVEALLSECERQVPNDVPTARFALETALLDLVARRRGVPMWSLLSRRTPDPLPVSTLVSGESRERLIIDARRASVASYRTVKYKLGGPTRLADDVLALTALRDALGDSVRLRLDANQTFSIENASHALGALARFGIEFLEEPVPTDQIAGLGDAPVPLAYDESLTTPDWQRIARRARKGIWVAVVLKPALLGGFAALLDHARRARDLGLSVTVSHLFDGPIALAAATHLALAVASRDHASGLAPHAGLDAWPNLPLDPFGSPLIEPPDRPGLGIDAGALLDEGSPA